MMRQPNLANLGALEKLLRLCESRQKAAHAKYQQQQLQVRVAQSIYDRRQQDQAAVEQAQLQLQQMMFTASLASSIRVQQQILSRRRWLQYDSDKTQYFFNDAKSALQTEKQEASRLRVQWLAQGYKVKRYQDKYNTAVLQREYRKMEIADDG